MKKSTKRWLSRTFRILLFCFLLITVHELLLKFIIFDFHAWRVEQHLIKDFHKNREQLDDLVHYAKQLKTLNHFEIIDKDRIRFTVYDSLTDKTDENAYSHNNFVNLGSFPYSTIHSIQLQDSNFVLDYSYDIIPDSIKIHKRDTLIIERNWAVSFIGSIKDPLVENLLSYNKIPLNQIDLLIQKLDSLKLKGIDNTENNISLTYAANWGEKFEYFIPLNDKDSSQVNMHKLADNYYWLNYQYTLVCGIMDWSQYYPLKQD